MTAGEAKTIVRTMRRHFFLASVLRGVTLGSLFFLVLGSVIQTDTGASSDEWWSVAMLIAIAWVAMSAISARQIRTANEASRYISTGHLNLAERELKNALRAFSVHRGSKLLICHNLAVVAHGLKEFSAAAELCVGLISLRVRLSHRLGRMCRILLADCRLQEGEAAGAYDALDSLSVDNPQLGLSERLILLPIELACCLARGDSGGMVASLEGKVQLAELLDAPKAGLVHALLARACLREQKQDAAAFLQRRADLYHDPAELIRDNQILRDSFESARSADNNAGSASQIPQG